MAFLISTHNLSGYESNTSWNIGTFFWVGDTNQIVSVAIDADLFVNGDDGAHYYYLPDGTGFRTDGRRAEFRFICRDHALVVDPDAYWFGDFADYPLHILVLIL
jgi:hypothetical protein